MMDSVECDVFYLDIFPHVVDHHNHTDAGRTVADGGEVEVQHVGSTPLNCLLLGY